MQAKTDAELDGDLAMELVELSAHGQGGSGASVEAVKIIREMIRREIVRHDLSRTTPYKEGQ